MESGVEGFDNSKKKSVEAHCATGGGHDVGETTARKVWNSGLRIPTTVKDVTYYCRQCDLCQRKPTEKDRMAFQLVLPLEPFQKWGFILLVHSNWQL